MLVRRRSIGSAGIISLPGLGWKPPRQRENGAIIDCPTYLIAVNTWPVTSGNKMASQNTMAPTTIQIIVLSFTRLPNHIAEGGMMKGASKTGSRETAFSSSPNIDFNRTQC